MSTLFSMACVAWENGAVDNTAPDLFDALTSRLPSDSTATLGYSVTSFHLPSSFFYLSCRYPIGKMISTSSFESNQTTWIKKFHRTLSLPLYFSIQLSKSDSNRFLSAVSKQNHLKTIFIINLLQSIAHTLTHTHTQAAVARIHRLLNILLDIL